MMCPMYGWRTGSRPGPAAQGPGQSCHSVRSGRAPGARTDDGRLFLVFSDATLSRRQSHGPSGWRNNELGGGRRGKERLLVSQPHFRQPLGHYSQGVAGALPRDSTCAVLTAFGPASKSQAVEDQLTLPGRVGEFANLRPPHDHDPSILRGEHTLAWCERLHCRTRASELLRFRSIHVLLNLASLLNLFLSPPL
jgi:hypothetical protein